MRRLYFIQNTVTGNIKIGVSNDPNKRLRSLQTGSADSLVLLGALLTSELSEAKAHDMFRKHRIRGEWFKPRKSLRVFIEKRFPDVEFSQEPAPDPLTFKEKARQIAEALENQNKTELEIVYEGLHAAGYGDMFDDVVIALGSSDSRSFANLAQKYGMKESKLYKLFSGIQFDATSGEGNSLMMQIACASANQIAA
jgi:hypothetical protein